MSCKLEGINKINIRTKNIKKNENFFVIVIFVPINCSKIFYVCIFIQTWNGNGISDS
jgi:hypothetical protein